VVLPEYELSDARASKAGGAWRATVAVRNAGTGRMPVQVAAVAGSRDARATVTLGAGEWKTVSILCPFEPERIVVDPDVQVLQLRRKAAVAELAPSLPTP
jgi:ABC-2 type transport system permease protein